MECLGSCSGPVGPRIIPQKVRGRLTIKSTYVKIYFTEHLKQNREKERRRDEMAELIRIKGLGGWNEIGASSTLVQCYDDLGCKRNLLIDAGVRMINPPREGKGSVSKSEPHAMPGCTIHAVLLTHAHADHASNVPNIFKENPDADLFATGPTFYIAGQSWLEFIFLMTNGHVEVPMDYILGFSSAVRRILETQKKNIVKKPGWVDIFPGISAYFGPNGHIRGSAFIVLKIGEKQIMFSGDISVYDSPTVKGMKIPEEFIGQLDVLFMESTYGDREVPEREEEEERMARLANEAGQMGGSSVWPAFAIGRSPDIFLAQMARNVEPLPMLDGSGRKILEIYADPERGYWSELDYSYDIDLNSEKVRRQIVGSKSQRTRRILSGDSINTVATAGMMSSGSCSSQYILDDIITGGGMSNREYRRRVNDFLSNPNNLIGVTGYQAENTDGWALLQAYDNGRRLEYDGRKIDIACQVVRFQLTSHASGFQLAEITKSLNPKKTFIGHGNKAGREGLEKNLRLIGYKGQIYVPDNGNIIEAV